MQNRSRPILLTGFEPFAHYATNPSWDAAAEASRRFPNDVVAVRLPVEYIGARDRLLRAIEATNPRACLCLGQAPEDAFRFEQIARKPKELAILEGEAQHASTWPWRHFADACVHRDIPHRFSSDAGAYVCESTLWSLLQHVDRGIHAGFLHVPAVSEDFPTTRTIEAVCTMVKAYLIADSNSAGD